MRAVPASAGSVPPASGRGRLVAAAERELAGMARAMVAAFVAEIPVYGHLPREQLDGEITELCRDSLRVFFASVRNRRTPTDEELTAARLSAARRAEERVPLDAVLAAYHVGGRVGWETLCRLARPDETDELVAVASGVMAYVQAVTGAVATAYLEEQQAIAGEVRDARRVLASALLEGAPVDGLASRADAVPAASYAVVAVRLGPHPDEAEPGIGGRVAGRRKVRRAQQSLDGWAGEAVLGLLEPAGGVVLLPVRRRSLAEVMADLPGLLAALLQNTGVPVTAGAAECPDPAGVPRAGRLASELLDLALALGRPPGVYTLDDLLLEYQLTRASDAHDRLAGLLAPLERPDLLGTVEAYVACGSDRRRAAAALHVHPNTLDYRLRRVRALTGLDPSTLPGLQLLSAALAARRASPATTPGGQD